MKNTYSEMKDSGVKWIKSLPVNWEKGRIKYSFYLKGRIGWQGLKSAEFLEDGPFYLITGTDFENGRVIWERCYRIAEDRYNEAPEIHVKNGDLLITKDGTIGKIAYIDSMPQCASLNSHLLIIRPLNKKYSNRYLFWVLLSSVFEMYCGLSQKGSIMASLSQEKMSDFCFPLPPPKEQSAIADYLDEKCGAIDEIIEHAKATIEEYKAWKSSVIFEAVTKGLDPNVEMKDSGVEWIGQVPKHWHICKLKFLCKMQAGKNITSEEIQKSGSYPVYGGNGIRGYFSHYNVDKESIVIGRQGALCGNVHLVANFFWATEHAVVTQCTQYEYIRHLFYLLKGMNLNQYASDSAAQPGLSVGIMENLMSILAPQNEQKQIAAYLDRKCSAIDEIIAEKEALIDDMDAYKKSLIFETVTGKRKVC